MVPVATTQLYHGSKKAATDNKQMRSLCSNQTLLIKTGDRLDLIHGTIGCQTLCSVLGDYKESSTSSAYKKEVDV